MHSCIYEGVVSHRRKSPTPHEFAYRLFMVYLDLSELDTVFDGRWLWSTKRTAFARFRRTDHLGDPSVPLDESVRQFVEQQLGSRPKGPIRLLTNLRYFGFWMNPVAFYYCFDESDSQVEYVVTEVNNTPWGEQHCYALRREDFESRRHRSPKEMHVSPFMPMDMEYQWQLPDPNDGLKVGIQNFRGGDVVHDARLEMQRFALSSGRLAWTLLRYPFMTQRVWQAIYWQALVLWWKKVPVFSHPGTAKPRESVPAPEAK